MAFEDVDILVRIGAGTSVARWRQDGAPGSVVTFSLSDNRDVRTYGWKLIGRPEGTGAAGGGPEPISLGTGQSCAISLDIQGTYIVACVINGGSPTQTVKTAGVAILCEITDPLGRPLRYLGGYESDEDLADPLVAQGWMKMLDRWLHAFEAFIRRGGVDTFKVAIDGPDVLAETYGYLPEKVTSPNGSIDITPRVEAAKPKVGLDVARRLDAPLTPCPGGNPGLGPQAAMWDHQHPPEGEGVYGATLFTGVIQDPALVDPVVAFLHTQQAQGGGYLTELFEELPGRGIWQRKSVGQLFGLDTVGGETIPLSVGDRVAFFAQDPARRWTATVVDVGSETTKAVIARSTDTFAHGTTFHVVGVGAYQEGTYWSVDDPDPVDQEKDDILWIRNDSFVDSSSNNLLTAAQLAMAIFATREMSVTIAAGGGSALFPIVFPTLPGTPGVSVFGAGPVVYEVLCYLTTDDPNAITYLSADLGIQGSGTTWIAGADSPPIHGTAAFVLKFSGYVTGAVPMLPTDLLKLRLYGHSNSASNVTIHVVYSDAGHRTRVTVPMQVGDSSIEDHKFSIDSEDEENRAADFAETKIVATGNASFSKIVGAHGKALQLTTKDEKVAVSTADASAAKAGYLANKARGDNITITAHVETDPVHGEQVVFSGVPAAPSSGGAWLYSARVPDTKLRDPVRTLVQANFRPLLLQPVKCLVADQGSWAQVYNPVALTLVHSTAGEIFGLDATHGNALSLEVGDRVWFRGEYTQWSQQWSGLFTVAAKGSVTEQAVLQATPFDALSVGKCFEVNGDGAYATGLWTCVQVSPALSFSSGEPLPDAVDGCGFGTWWEQIPGTNLWQAPVAGPIYGQDQFADPSILLGSDDRVLAYNSDHVGDEGQYYGPYEVLDPGFYYPPGAAPVLTRAIIRRVLDADSSSELCNGMTVRVTPGSVAYSGNYFTIATADPIEVDTTVISWSIAGSYTDGGTDRLLTESQLGMASTATAEVATEVPALQLMEILLPLRPVTLDGTPGVSEFPAGPVTYEIACRVSSDDPTAEVLISAALSPSNVGAVWIAEATSQPIRATATTVYRLRAQVSAAVPLSLSDVLYLWLWVSNSGSSPVTLTIVYNDVAHSTRIQTTLNLAAGGTDDHRRLTAVSKGWSTGQEKWSGLFEHPDSTVCKRFPVDCSATIETGDGAGVLVIPDNCSGPIRVTGTELRAIAVKDADGNVVFGKLAPIKLHFVNTCTVRHLDGLSGLTAPWIARAGKINLLPSNVEDGADYDMLIPALRTMRLYLDQPEGGSLTWYIEVGQ